MSFNGFLRIGEQSHIHLVHLQSKSANFFDKYICDEFSKLNMLAPWKSGGLKTSHCLQPLKFTGLPLPSKIKLHCWFLLIFSMRRAFSAQESKTIKWLMRWPHFRRKCWFWYNLIQVKSQSRSKVRTDLEKLFPINVHHTNCMRISHRQAAMKARCRRPIVLRFEMIKDKKT